ncbi:MAG: pantetheine-phosphate adenylyltransferase [Candidatus Omnitrophica bacterium]|nr:pantetheine-phosphate adenylyltransferase [Candidatus Omnitrophota bacterium]
MERASQTSRAVYPGTFDPVTYGHIDIIKRAHLLFDEVIVACAENAEKATLFTLEERIAMLREATEGIAGVSVEPFYGLVVDFVRTKKINVMIRGLRMISDFEYEFQMALTNRRLDDTIETIFMMPSEQYSFLSSKLIKEAAGLGATGLVSFIPAFVEERLQRKLHRR